MLHEGSKQKAVSSKPVAISLAPILERIRLIGVWPLTLIASPLFLTGLSGPENVRRRETEPGRELPFVRANPG